MADKTTTDGVHRCVVPNTDSVVLPAHFVVMAAKVIIVAILLNLLVHQTTCINGLLGIMSLGPVPESVMHGVLAQLQAPD